MVKHTLTVLLDLPQDFEHMFNVFVDSRWYRINKYLCGDDWSLIHHCSLIRCFFRQFLYGKDGI